MGAFGWTLWFWFAIKLTRLLYSLSPDAARWWCLSSGLYLALARRFPGERLCDVLGLDRTRIIGPRGPN